MIDLQYSCSLSIKFDQRDNTFYFSDSLNFNSERSISLTDLLPVLLNKSLIYPQKVYTQYTGLKDCSHGNIFCSQLTYDLLYLPPGLLGIEYIKSHVYYAKPKSEDDQTSSDIVEVTYGVLTIILQKLEQKDPLDFDTNVSSGLIMKLRKGEQVIIPRGYYYTFINTRNTPVIFVRVHKNHNNLDYSKLKREQGLAYYVIRKNARQEVVMNPRYRVIPKIQRVTPEKLTSQVRTLGKSPLYMQVTRNPQKFMEMF